MIYYNGKYSITFFKKNDNESSFFYYLNNYEDLHKKGFIKNTWIDWKMIPVNKIIISPPLKKRSILDLPGSIGNIDLTNAIAGYPLYSNRTGSMEFYISNDNIYTNGHKEISKIYSEVLRFFNNEEILMVLDYDKFFYYIGRFQINSINPDIINMSKITIEYDIYPYKQAIVSSYDDEEKWLWDPFDFEVGYIQESYKPTFKISNGSKIKIICGDEPKSIELIFSSISSEISSIYVDCINKSLIGDESTVENKVYTKETKKFIFSDLPKNINVEKEFTFRLDGTAKVKIEYNGGFL